MARAPSSPTKRRLSMLFLWGLVLFALDRSFVVFRYPGKTLFMRITRSKAECARDFLERTDGVPEVVVLGSSHALFGIDPEALFDDPKDARRAYNFGIGGVGANQQRLLSEALLKRGTPQRLVLTVDYFTFNQPPDAGWGLVAEMLGYLADERLELEHRTRVDSGSDTGAEWGGAVGLSGVRAVLGASQAGPDASAEAGGAVRVLIRDGGRWRDEATLTAADGAPDDRFGSAVAIDGETILVGAWRNDAAGPDTGAAYVFVRGAEGWTREALLLPSDGGVADAFGAALAVQGDVAVVGARHHDERGANAGAAYVFERERGVWRQTARLLASDGEGGDQFGTAVALHGRRILVGAPKKARAGPKCGAAYVFRRGADDGPRDGRDGRDGRESRESRESRDGWVEEARLIGGDALTLAELGSSVALAQERALLAAPGRGRAYVFERDVDGWSETQGLNAALGGRLLGPVCLADERALVAGTRGDGERAVYAFALEPELGWKRLGSFAPSLEQAAPGPIQLALAGRNVLIGARSASAAGAASTGVFAGVLPETVEESAGAQPSLRERIPLASYAYRHREDVMRYLEAAVGGKTTLPFLRGNRSPEEGMFTRFESAEIDPRGQADGKGLADPTFLRRRGSRFDPVPFAVEALGVLIDQARSRGVRVDLVHVPEHVACHAEKQRYLEFAGFVREFAREHRIVYHDFNRIDAFPLERTDLFFDTDHLNETGAKLFSRRLGARLGLRQTE